MKKKIYLSICFVAFCAVLITGILVSCLIYNSDYSEMKDTVKIEAEYIGASIPDSGVSEYLDTVKNVSVSRITWIDKDGHVIYDSTGKQSEMEDHSDRPEFNKALDVGYGESERLSETISSNTYYYALRMDDGTVLRISRTVDSVFKVMLGSAPFIVLISVFVFIIAAVASIFITKRIVKPINELDLENPENNIAYDEITPLLSRIKKQNEDLAEHMDTLKYEQLQFNAITENMSEGFLVIDDKNFVLSYNKSILDILNIKEKDIHKLNILSVNRSLKFRKAVENVQKGISTEDEISFGGRTYMLLVNCVMQEEVIKGAVIMLLDITEKHERDRLRREFSANVSHELKTPLTSISGYAEIMKDGMVKPEDMTRFSDKIYVEAQRLIMLVEDIIKLSQLEEKGAEYTFETLDLYEIAESVCDRLKISAARKSVKIVLTGERAYIQGVKYIIDEMLFNICENAVKYNINGGNVLVDVENNGLDKTVTVTDTGIGIPPEDKDRVFERFYRVDKSHSKETGGTGLGLSIVKHGAFIHNAKIELNSELGKGTKIKIIFNN